MAIPLNILLVEDSPDDAALILDELRRGGYEPIATRVDREPDFRENVGSHLDVILSDYSLPSFTVDRGLQILRECGLNVPFIVVSGTIGEERAVETLKSGATDYVLKDRLQRLVPVLHRALRDAALSEERMRAEEQLRIQAAVLDSAANSILVTDRSGRILWTNRAFTDLTGYAASEVVGRTPRVLKSGRHSLEFYKELWATITSGHIWRGEFINRRKDGRIFYDEHTITPVRGEDGVMTHFIGIMNDVTERKEVEASLRASEERFRQLAQNAKEVFYMADRSITRVLYVSPAYERIWGRTCESLYQSPASFMEAVHADDQEQLQHVLEKQRRGEETYSEYRVVRPDGTIRWVRDHSFPIRKETGQIYRIAGLVEDITERRQLEMQMRQMQKMESIGQLAGGVAHDFNNHLAVIQIHASLLMGADRPPFEVKNAAEQISLAAEGAVTLTRQLLTFSRKQVMQTRLVDLNDITEGMVKMLKRVLGGHVTLEFHRDCELAMVRVDSGMMDQVLMNLALNARDAMPEGGRMVVRTNHETIEETHLHVNPQARPGPHVCLSVSDTGTGMAPEIVSRIFEPFFTTKESGKGTGLGLAIVYGIVKQHMGWISVYSEVGKGTVFRVHLPSASSQGAPDPDPDEEVEVRGGKETILLVEDEAPFRALVRHALERYGYTVIEANSGAHALEIWDKAKDRIELVLTDMVLPGGITGRKLIEILHESEPDLPVIYSSGYSVEVAGQGLALQENVNFLQKPYPARRLAIAVRHALDG